MALRLQRREWKRANGEISSAWRLIVEDYTSGKRLDFYPPRTEYARYGLNPSDTYEDALEKLKTVRAVNKVEKSLERRARIQARLNHADLKASAYLPPFIYDKWIDWLCDRRMWTKIPDKTHSHLRCMRRLIIDLNVDPSTLPNRPEKVYRWFVTKKLSRSYIEKVLPLLNEYGYFYSNEFKKPWLPIPSPSGDIARRIEDANLEERDGKGSASKPIFPHHLDSLSGLPPEQIAWLRVSIYFGLRPEEVDDLSSKNMGKVWRIAKDTKGTPILHFYQKKLVKIDRERRWKRIPCILPEQKQIAKELVNGTSLKRPYTKTLEKYLGEGHFLYGGRKGFEQFMREQGQDFVNISRWLGHQDIRRTEQNYRQAEAVEYDPVLE